MASPLINKGFNGWAQLGVFLGMWGVGFIAAALATWGIWGIMTGHGIMSMERDMLNVKYANALKVIQLVSTLFIFFIPVLLYAFICYLNGWQALGFGKKPGIKILGISLLILIASMPAIDALTLLNKIIPLSPKSRIFFDDIEKKYEEQVKIIGDVKTVGQYILSLFMIAFLPAVFEETLFRGGLQNMFTRWWKSSWTAIIVTSILFSAVHASWYGFLPRIGLGILLGLLFFKTQNIWYNIFIHFVNNATVVTFMFINARQGKPADTSNGMTFPWWTAIFSIAALVYLFHSLKKIKQEQMPVEIFYDRNNPFENPPLV